MNVELPKKTKETKIRGIAYIIILVLCFTAIIIAIAQMSSNKTIKTSTKTSNKNNETIQELKEDFNIIFTNTINISKKNGEQQENTNYKNLVYTDYMKQNKSQNNFDIKVNIPYINSNTEVAKKYNNDIKSTFEDPAEFILQTQNRNIIYTVDYIANITDNILSVAILSTFKEGNNPQRTMIKTYNYNLTNNQELSLEALIQEENFKKASIEEAINNEIKKSQDQVDKLKELGYEIHSRNINDSMYKIENSTEFFMYNNHLYVVYAYGNDILTNEMDIVII